MTRDRAHSAPALLALLALGALTWTGLAAARLSPALAAAPADAPDWPERLSVGPGGEVFVAMGTDSFGGAVLRLAEDGTWLGRWPASAAIRDIAVGPDGQVYLALAGTGQVVASGPDGSGPATWAVSGTLRALAAGPYGRSLGGSVYALADVAGGPAPGPSGTPGPAPSATPPPGREVSRHGPGGGLIAAWPVERSAYDLAAGWLAGGGPDGVVLVADAAVSPTPRVGASRLAIYEPDGTLRKAVDNRFEIRGLGVWPQHHACLGLTPELSPYAFTDCVDVAGVSVNQFPLADGQLRDLSVDPVDGDVVAILDEDLVWMSADGRPLRRLTREQLNAQPTPTATATATATATPTATATATATAPGLDTATATATLTATEPGTVTPTAADTQAPPTGTATRPGPSASPTAPTPAGPLFLPYLSRRAELVSPLRELGRYALDDARYCGIGLEAGLAAIGERDARAARPPRLALLDIRDPARPFGLGGCALVDWPAHVAVTGGHAYVASLRAGLAICDVREPRFARVVATVPARIAVLAVAVAGSRAYLLDGPAPRSDIPAPRGEQARLLVLDVSRPEAPRELGALPLPGLPLGLAAYGDRRLLIAAGGAGLLEIDARDPAAPRLASRLPVADAAAVAVSGELGLLLDGGLAGELELAPSALRVVDLATGEPRLLGSVEGPWEGLGGEGIGPTTVALAGRNGYAADARWIWPIDVGEAARPRRGRPRFLAGAPGSPPLVCDLAAAGGLLLAADLRYGARLLAGPP